MTDSYFFSRTDLDRARTQSILDDALKGADDGELFLAYGQSESFVFDDNRLKAANFDVQQGFGLRAVCGESTGYAHASELSEAALKRAGSAVQAVKSGAGGQVADGPGCGGITLQAHHGLELIQPRPVQGHGCGIPVLGTDGHAQGRNHDRGGVGTRLQENLVSLQSGINCLLDG